MLTAAALRCLGGEMQAQLWPTTRGEIERAQEQGIDDMEQTLLVQEAIGRQRAAALDGPTRIESLVNLQNVSLKLAQRITCDEEERQRFGYKLVTSYRFPDIGGKLDRNDAEVYCSEQLAMHLSYGDASDLFRINLGWANQRGNQPPGFNLEAGRGP